MLFMRRFCCWCFRLTNSYMMCQPTYIFYYHTPVPPQSVSPSCRISLILKIVPETRAASLWLSVYRGKHFFSVCAFPKSLWENVTDCWQSRATLCSSHFQETPTNSCNKKRFVLLFSCVAPEETSANTDRRRYTSSKSLNGRIRR